MNGRERWEDITSKKGSRVFKEFFLDWTCPHWISKKLHGGKRSSDVTQYFNKLTEKPSYLNVDKMKKDGRNGVFYRGNLQPFFDYAKSKDIVFTEMEKSHLNGLFNHELSTLIIRNEVCNLGETVISGILALFREAITCVLIEHYPKRNGTIELSIAAYSLLGNLLLNNKALFEKVVKLTFSKRTANSILLAKLEPTNESYLVEYTLDKISDALKNTVEKIEPKNI